MGSAWLELDLTRADVTLTCSGAYRTCKVSRLKSICALLSIISQETYEQKPTCLSLSASFLSDRCSMMKEINCDWYMASKSALTHSGERSEVGVGKTRAVLLVKWQNGGQRYEKRVAKRIGGKKKKCSIDLHLALHHLGTLHFVGIVI